MTHGNLAGPQPKAVVLVIGTNDLAYGRSPTLTADGIRASLEVLRQRLPKARILLFGLLPREESPSAPLRLEVAQVNRLISDCADDQHIFYAEIDDVPRAPCRSALLLRPDHHYRHVVRGLLCEGNGGVLSA